VVQNAIHHIMRAVHNVQHTPAHQLDTSGSEQGSAPAAVRR
jgi:hypothetical protein